MKLQSLMFGLMLGSQAILQSQAPALSAETRHAGDLVVVTGSCLMKVSPDFVVFSAGVETVGPNVSKIVKENTAKVQKLLAALKSLGVKPAEIQTSAFHLGAFERKGVRAGYRVTNQVTVSRGDVSNVGELIEAALNAGANEIEGPTFSIGDEKLYQRQGIESAFQDARTKANQLAVLSGRKLGAVVGVTDGTAPNLQEATLGYGGLTRGFIDKLGKSIESGSTSITFTVSVAFRLE